MTYYDWETFNLLHTLLAQACVPRCWHLPPTYLRLWWQDLQRQWKKTIDNVSVIIFELPTLSGQTIVELNPGQVISVSREVQNVFSKVADKVIRQRQTNENHFDQNMGLKCMFMNAPIYIFWSKRTQMTYVIYIHPYQCVYRYGSASHWHCVALCHAPRCSLLTLAD